MNETPEAVRDRIKAEELAKGSDPRVAEGRAKAAEMRARHGLPIAPQEAWVAKLAQEGGTAAVTAQPVAAPAPAQSPAAEPEPAPAAPPAPPEPEAEPAPAEPAATQAPSEAAAPAAAQAPSTEPVSAAAPPVQPEPAAAAPAPPEPMFEPEVGEIIEREDEVVFKVGGIKVRDARIATWILILLLAIPLWAMLYLLALGGGNVGRATTGCIVEPDRSFTCFHPKHETGPSGGH